MRILNPLAGPFRAVRSSLSPAPRSTHRRRTGRRAIATFFAVFLLANVAFSVGMDRVFPSVRDPEYGRRAKRWHQRQRENPDREFVALLGSSRMAMGVRPEHANNTTGPLVFNFSLVGSGPIMELMVLKRLLHSGIKPDGVIFEYWPAFLREDGYYAEEGRTDPHRLLPMDEPFVNEWFAGTEHFLSTMRRIRWNPFYEHRLRIISQIVPAWLGNSQRLDAGWEKLDGWGWLPGYHRDLSAAERIDRHKHSNEYFSRLFTGYSIDEKAHRAMREIVALCRQNNIRVRVIWLPESSEFRAAYPPTALRMGEEFIASFCRETGTPLIDARSWVPDEHIGDGLHLSIPGAAVFSRKFGDYLRNQP